MSPFQPTVHNLLKHKRLTTFSADRHIYASFCAQYMSVADFKAKMGVERIDVKQNPNTGKCFFVYGCETGAVSERFLKGDITKPVISQVCSPETGDMFYILHQQGDGGAPTLATL